MISGPVNIPVLRRCLRPAIQSSHDITSFIGIVGTPESESFGVALDELPDVGFIFVRRQFSNAQRFVPINFNLTPEACVDKLIAALREPKENLLEVIWSGGMLVRP